MQQHNGEKNVKEATSLPPEVWAEEKKSVKRINKTRKGQRPFQPIEQYMSMRKITF